MLHSKNVDESLSAALSLSWCCLFLFFSVFYKNEFIASFFPPLLEVKGLIISNHHFDNLLNFELNLFDSLIFISMT